MKPFLISFFAAIVFILPGSLTATIYYVNPGERIQDAIDGSTNGDGEAGEAWCRSRQRAQGVRQRARQVAARERNRRNQ